MGITDIFSKRAQRSSGKVPEVYTYDKLPSSLRIQIVHILNETIGVHLNINSYHQLNPDSIYKMSCSILCKEYGVFNLDSPQYHNRMEPREELINFFINTKEIEKCLDIVEILFWFVNVFIREDKSYNSRVRDTQDPDSAIDELNYRFREAGVGYQFEKDANKIIRVDNQFTHSQVTKPALHLLHDQNFKGAQDEFLKAHDAYKEGRNKDCLVECLKAFESTMKTICDNKGWAYNATDPAKKLIQVCFDNGLIPKSLQAQFSSLQQIFESGVPTIRNKNAGHGQGNTPKTPEDELVRYTLNLTASNIVFFGGVS